ncbi:MAG: hypothetical protein JXM79_25260 [Sedimentisphaerales bacterium]|nr:hypothetical protein [Sedimentisphaerales bacterium]
MPARRRKQSNAMLYTLITFVGLFIASTTVAVIYYVKAEEHRTSLEETQRTLGDLASEREQQATGAIIGAKKSGGSWLGTMVAHLNHTVSLVLGGVPEESISAEVKVTNADTEVLSTLNMAKGYLDIPEPNLTDPNIIGLVPVVKRLVNELKNIIDANNVTSSNLAKLQDDFDNANKAHLDAVQKLTAEKDDLQKSVEETKQKYADLETLLQQTTDEKVQTLSNNLQQMENERNALNETLLKTQAELAMAQGRLQLAREEVNQIMPGPDPNVLALEPDGKIISIDDQTHVVHLDKGSKDRIYQGLTFTVYDRGSAIPKDGKGKAEVEVFDVAENLSAARIITSELNRPILQGDIVANLIWDSDRTNQFVITGEFDLDKDGNIDIEGGDRVKLLIEKWGGQVADNITIDTDFVVLGHAPQTLQRPTLEQTDIDPQAMQRYNNSVQAISRYNGIKNQAQGLWIPVLTYEKFLYFIGYEGQIERAGAF